MTQAGAPDIDVLEREGIANVPDPERLRGSDVERRWAPSRRERRRPPPRRLWLAVLVGAFLASLISAGVGRRDLVNTGGWGMVRRFFAAAVHPELSGEFLRLTWDATLTTLAYAVLGTALSVGIGVVGGVLVSQTWWRSARWAPGPEGTPRAGAGWMATRAGLGVPRAVHEAIWALFLLNVLGRNPLVGVLAIAIPYGAVTAKVYSELLDEAPPAAFRALRAGGAGRLKALFYGLGPQALPDLLSYAFYRFECSIRAATILGFIGAGGLGFQLSLSFQSLRYSEMWTLLYVLILVSGLADLWSRRLRSRLTSPVPESLVHAGSVPGRMYFGSRMQLGVQRRSRRDRLLSGSVILVAVLVVLSIWHLGIDTATLWAGRTRTLLADVASSAYPPRLDSAALSELARLSVETLAMAVMATVLAAAGAIVFAFVAAGARARDGTGSLAARTTSLAARAILLACRAIPPPVWALLFLFVLFPGPLPGALALAVYNFGILGRLMAEVVENLDPRPVLALTAQGAGRARAFLYGALPVALPRFAAYSLYRWEVTIRETVVVGLVGAGGLGRLLQTQLASFDYRSVVVTLAALVVLTFVVDVAGASLRRALR